MTAQQKLGQSPTDVEPQEAPKRRRHFNRPTTPELEALYFKVAVHLTKRETALFMHCMGRTADGGKALAEMFLLTPGPAPIE